MTHHTDTDHEARTERRDEPGSRVVWGHSLAAAAICLGTAAVIALISIFV